MPEVYAATTPYCPVGKFCSNIGTHLDMVGIPIHTFRILLGLGQYGPCDVNPSGVAVGFQLGLARFGGAKHAEQVNASAAASAAALCPAAANCSGVII